jgi:hypothetical protein
MITSLRLHLLAGLVGAALSALWMLGVILGDKNSTAAVGLLFLPVLAGVGALAGVFVAFFALTLRDLAQRRWEGMWWRAPLVLLVAVVGALCGWRWSVESHWLAQAQAEDTSASVLGQLHQSRAWLKRDAIAEALATNRNTPPDVLEAIASEADPRLLRSVGENPGAPAALVERIAAGPLDYFILAGVVKNPQLSRASMERLSEAEPTAFRTDVDWRLFQSHVLAPLVRRDGFPADLYERISRHAQLEDFLLFALIESPHSSCEVLQRFTAAKIAVVSNTLDRQRAQRGCAVGSP